MGMVGGTRHYVGGGLGDERGWTCPSCGAENLGLIALGCQLCGAGAPGRKADAPPPPPPPPLDPPAAEGEEQLGVFDRWALAHPQATLEEAFAAGYAEGVRAMRQVPPAPPAPSPVADDATLGRTVIAALELFRDQILAGDPEEVRTGEWLSAAQVDQFITQIASSLGPAEAPHV